MPGPKLARSENRSALDESRIEELIALAKGASANAYCPYSKFRVGAVVLTTSGEVYTGCNVENASYGLTICAERNAIFRAVASGGKSIAAVVIYTPTDAPAAPCGACRQVINEFGPDALVISACDSPHILKMKLFDLLPDAFGPKNLS